MNYLKFFSTVRSLGIATVVACLSGTASLQAQTQSEAATHIQGYYQKLMPTIQQAGKLSVREREVL